MPVWEDDVGGDGAQVLEEVIAGAAGGGGGAPGEDGELGDGVEGEGEEVEGDEQAGEGELAVAEVVFEVVAVGLEDVEGLILDLPAGPAAGGESLPSRRRGSATVAAETGRSVTKEL